MLEIGIMTSEVIIMNKKAAVIAADSAITVTSRAQSQEKYYKNANKIFEGSFSNPISIMFFDNVELNGVPWEIIIKGFRDNISGKIYKSLNDYSNDLYKYIENMKSIFNEDREKQIFHDLFSVCLAEFVEKINKKSKELMETSGKDIQNSNFDSFIIIKDEIDSSLIPEETNFLSSVENLQKCLLDINEFIGVDEIVPGVNNNNLIKSALKFFQINYFEYSIHTGIVICGFGCDDYFPSIINIDVYGILFGKVIYRTIETAEISLEKPSHIQSFAMDDMANTFMYGIGSNTRKSILINHLKCLMEIKAEFEKSGAEVSDPDQLISDQFSKFNFLLTKEGADNHFSPLTMAIGSLAPDEMAHLAETLISLESLKERVTRPSESVGGPIDIAVLTKNEGLVWVQRKHYFPSELNLRYAERQRRKMK